MYGAWVGLYNTYIWIYQEIICILHVAEHKEEEEEGGPGPGRRGGGEAGVFCFCFEAPAQSIAGYVCT